MQVNVLARGVKVVNAETHEKGIIIDWGVNPRKFRSYIPLPSYYKQAEAVRVRTKKSIEVWPVGLVSFE